MSDFDRGLHAAMRQAQRRTTSLSILDFAAWLGLIAGTIFWGNFFFTLLAPASLPAAVQAVVLSIGYAIVLPMLLSMLVPSTPAGMLLQSTRYRTVGFVVTIAAALFMSAHAGQVLWSWWLAQPSVAASQQDRWLAIGSFIVYVVVPALAWVQATPDRWVAEIQQAQKVRQVKAAQEANLMVIKEQYLRLISLMRRGAANLTAAECREAASIFIGLQRAENEAIGQIADSIDAVSGVSTGISMLDDQQMIDAYHGISNRLLKLIAPINEADYVDATPSISTSADRYSVSATVYSNLPEKREPHQDASPAKAEASATTSTLPSVVAPLPHAAAPGRTVRQYAAELEAVASYGEMFSAKSLSAVIQKSERQARYIIAAWVADGVVAKGESGSYYIIKESR